MDRPDALELTSLVATLRRTEPEQETLCEGWQARHLLAHLFLRRHQPWAALRQGPGSTLGTLAEEARDPARYAALVDRFAASPPRLTPMAVADGPLGPVINLVEYVVHHEDLRRGEGPAPARPLPPETSDAVFDAVALMARLSLRGAGTGVVLGVPGGRRTVVRRGADAVAVLGGPVDLALVVTGRRDAADVEVLGAPETVERFEAGVTGR